ncbi:MAG: hypothetical protein JNL82_09290 [Myxococcales bacterium]|nr:hypothetical protein [Myxococcales bacterium]
MVVLIAAAPSAAVGMPQAAREHNNRGAALILVGQYEAGVAELEQAYAALADPLRYRSERGKVLGSLRGALLRRYDATGDPAHLCRLRKILQRHRDELLAALGRAVAADDTAGVDDALRSLDAQLAGRTCEEPAPPPFRATAPRPPPVVAAAAVGPPPLRPADRSEPRARRLRRVGGVLLGAGVLAAIGSVVATVIYTSRFRRLDALDRWLMSDEEAAEELRRYVAARDARTAAIVTGSAGAALLLAGVTVLAGSSRARRVRLVPAGSPSAWGFSLQGRF